MPSVDIVLPKPHANQKHIIEAALHTRFTVAACGRRFGKTEAAKQIVIRLLMEGKMIWWLMPTFAMSTKAWRDIVRTLRHFPYVVVSQTDRRIELPTGGVLEVKSTHNADMLRGAGLDFAVLDEAAFMEPSVWPAVVRPMLMERSGGALFLSTPFGRNWFWELYNRGLDPTQGEYKSLHFKSEDNPRLPEGEIESARLTTPERIFKEEYLAEFTGDGGAVFRNVEQTCTGETQARRSSGRYVIGVDWARDNDYTVLSVMDANNYTMVAMDRFNQIGWSLQRGRLTSLCQQYPPELIVAESNSIGSVNIEALQMEGLPVASFTTTATSKPPLIEALSLSMERNELTLLNDDVLKSELSAYQIERMPSGNYRYNAPSGMHDDTVMATALAWHGVQNINAAGLMIDSGLGAALSDYRG